MDMFQLKNYLNENNISIKDFAKITKVKEKKLNSVLDGRSYFISDEARNVSAFLGVSSNELFHGVVERIGELPEVSEKSNLNHFRYYVKNRFKAFRYIINILAFIIGGLFAVLTLAYAGLMFAGITGLPTILRSLEVLLGCLIIPLFVSVLFMDIAKEKLLEKYATAHCKINVESLGVSLMLFVYSVCAYVNDFIPVVSLVLILLGGFSLSAISIISPFEKTPFKNRALQFFVYMIPTLFLVVAEAFIRDYVVEITPVESGAEGHSLATASNFFSYVFALVILVVFGFCLLGFVKTFVKGVGKFFEPYKKIETISKRKIINKITACVLLCIFSYLTIILFQGLYLKNMYITMFEGQEDTVNWTSELITDYDVQFKKGEYDTIKFDGMKIEIPKGYKFDNESEYTSAYKNNDESVIMLKKPYYEQTSDYDLFDEDFGDGKLNEDQLNKIKETFVESFGFYPTNFYDWQKLNGTVTLDDIDIFNPEKTAILSTVFIMKANTVLPNSEYYLYENGDLYATITIATIENEEKGNKEMVSISFGSKNLEYSVTMAHPDRDNEKTVEEITKILNSIEQNKTTK